MKYMRPAAIIALPLLLSVVCSLQVQAESDSSLFGTEAERLVSRGCAITIIRITELHSVVFGRRQKQGMPMLSTISVCAITRARGGEEPQGGKNGIAKLRTCGICLRSVLPCGTPASR